MRITVVVPSRGRVLGLMGILRSMRFLESGKHEVHYVVGVDDDDEETRRACEWLGNAKHMPLGVRVDARPVSLGGLINELALCKPADVYTAINDDIVCLSPNWDEGIAKAIEKTPHGVFWWTDGSGNGAMFPIVSELWRAAAGGIFSEWFPFWYDDLCLAELWTMATQEDNVFLDIEIADKPRTITHRMRELKFWQNVYIATRKLRVKQAHDIAAKLGLQAPDGAVHVASLMNNHLKRVSDEWIDEIEKNQGDKTPADENYRIARARAEAMLAEVAPEIAANAAANVVNAVPPAKAA